MSACEQAQGLPLPWLHGNISLVTGLTVYIN